MKISLKNCILTLLFAIIIFFMSLIGCSNTKKPLLTVKRPFDIIAFYEKGWGDFTYGYPSLIKHYQDIDILAPYWYTLHGDGSLIFSKVGFEQKAFDFANRHSKIKLIPLVNNSRNSTTMLTDPKIRSHAIDNLMKEINEKNFAGVNIDFELLPAEVRDDFTSFIRELSDKLRSKKKILSVSVFPKLDGLSEISHAYNYTELAKYADFITLMTYDKHSSSSGPGSIAPYDWVEKNIAYALNFIPKDKLFVCIGAYGYDWTLGSKGDVEYLGLKEILYRAKVHKAKIQWDDMTQSPFFTYQLKGIEHEVWFENGFSARKKVTLAKKYAIRGVAIWRIGFEDEEYWSKIKHPLQNDQ